MPSEPHPCVSVVIPLFNAAMYVEQAVQSALTQSETLEVIVVDDGSTDDGPARCRALAREHPEKLLMLTHADGQNHGVGASRNLAIMGTRGELIAFLDADDYFLPDRFRVSVPRLLGDRELDGVYEAVQMTFEGAEARRGWDPEVRTLISVPENVPPRDLLPLLTRGGRGNFHTDGLVLRRRVFERAGVLETDLSLGQDTEFCWRVAATCRLVGGQLDRPVAIYRRHAGNRSGPFHPEFRRTRLTVARRTWDWARRIGCGHEQLRVLESAYARALAAWDAGSRTEWLRIVARSVVRDPGVVFGFAFCATLLRRVARSFRYRINARSPVSPRIAASDGLRVAVDNSDLATDNAPRLEQGVGWSTSLSLALAVLTFVALSVSTALVRETFHDEGVTYDQVVAPLTFDHCADGCAVASLRSPPPGRPHDVIRALRERGLHPPAYYLLLSAWTGIAGLSLFSVRLPGIIMGALTVIGLASLGGRLVGPFARSAIAWLAAVSPWLVQISAYARPYSMALALTVWTSYLLVSKAPPSRSVLVAWVVLSALGMYTIYHYAFVIGIQVLLWLWLKAINIRTRMITAAAGLMCLLFLYGPWLQIARHHLQRAQAPFYFHGRLSPIASAPAFLDLFSRFTLGGFVVRYGRLAPLALMAMIVLFLVRRRRQLKPGVRFIVYYVIGLAALIFTADQLFNTHTLFIGKTAFGLYPAIVLLLTAASAGFGRMGPRAVACLFAAATVLQVAREASRFTDLQRVAASVRSQGNADRQLVIMNHSKRGYAYPLVIELERAGLSRARLAVADNRHLGDTVRRALEGGRATHVTLVEFFQPGGRRVELKKGDFAPRTLWDRQTLHTIVAAHRRSITIFRGVVPHSPHL